MKRLIWFGLIAALAACNPAATTPTPGSALPPTLPNLPAGAPITAENAGDLRQIAGLRGHHLSVFGLVFSPPCPVDDAGCTPSLISLSADGVRLWNLTTRTQRALLVGQEGVTHVFYAVAATSDGGSANRPERVVTVHGDGTVSVWAMPTGEAARAFDGHPAAIGPAALSPDGKALALGGEDGQVMVWDITSGARLHALSGARTVVALAYAPDGGILATASDDATIRLWDTATGAVLQTLSDLPAPATTLAFASDGARFAAGAGTQVRLWAVEWASGKLNVTSREPLPIDWGAADAALAFSPDGTMLALGGSLDEVRLWDLERNLQARLPDHASGVLTLDFSPDGSAIVTTSAGAPARVWQLSDGRQLAILGDGETSSAAARFAPDGRTVAVDAGGTVALWGAP